MPNRIGIFALSLPLGLLAGCGGDGTTAGATTPGGPSPPPSVTSLELTASHEFPIFLGETAELQLTAVRSDNSRLPVDGALATWRSSNRMAATVSAGVVTAVEPGNSEVTAGYQGASAEIPVPVRIAPTARGKVRVLYAAPADRPFRPDYSSGISWAMREAQTWFRGQLKGLTFELHEDSPEFCQMPEDSDHYATGDAWDKVVEGVQDCAPVALDTPGISWYLFADVQERCGEPHELGMGGNGAAIVPRHDLEVLARSTSIHGCKGPVTRSRPSIAAGFAHELAHNFGLPHPPGCDDKLAHCDLDALMSLGYLEYPDTYLRPGEKEFLMRSRFLRRTGPRDASPGELAIKGVVRDASRAPLPGIRVSIMSDSYWNWEETAITGAFSIGVPDGESGPFLVSVHAGDTAADCNWLGYHGPDGLHSLRGNATLVSVADGDPEPIEVTLPLAPDELCNLDRTLSGVVVGPEGRPVEGVRVWFHRFGISTDRDGSWSHRLFEGWWSHHLHWPLSITLLQCDKEIFFTTDGSSEDRHWAFELARRFEVAPAGITDVRLRLRATPEQLCREG
ncbi:MAG: hypothetical protein F4174_02735 [Acidobacteria bacterium]|nr:hypothetical protein [Acidobacteriota bacterium]